MIYHYTDRKSARGIIAAGILRAHPIMVYDTLFGAFDGPGHVLAPAVWFTVRDEPSPTVLVRLILDSCPVDRPGELWRFAVADDVGCDLEAWARGHGYGPELFSWLLTTAGMAGESWQDWRLSSHDVPREQWLHVQSWRDGLWAEEV